MNQPRRGTMKRWMGTLVLLAMGVVLTIPVGGALGIQSGTVNAASTPVAHFYSSGASYVAAGYSGMVNTGNLTRVRGAWNVAAITCQPKLGAAQYQTTSVSFGVGITDTAYAIENATCASGSSTPSYYLYARFPAGQQVVFGQVSPGDFIQGTIATVASARCGGLAIHVTVVVNRAISNPGRAHHCAAGFSPTSASWAVADNNGGSLAIGALAQFAPAVLFTSSTVEHSGTNLAISQLYLGSVFESILVNPSNYVIAQTTPLSPSGEGFSVAWVNSSATAYTLHGSTSVAGYQGSIGSGNLSRVSATWTNPSLACQQNLGTDQYFQEFVSLGESSVGTAYAMERASCATSTGPPVYDLTLLFPNGQSVSMSGSNVGDLAGVKLLATITTSATTRCGLLVHAAITDLSNRAVFHAGRCARGFSPTIASWGVSNEGSGYLIGYSPPVKFASCAVVSSGTRLTLSQLSDLQQYTMVDGSSFLEAEPTILAASGSAFSVWWITPD